MLAVWEASTRASHHFLTPDQITELKPLVPEAFAKADAIAGIRDDSGNVVGFVGVEGPKLEMLFLHPDHQGAGHGGRLVRYAREKMGATLVDVNEGNHEAIAFYERQGATLVGRSETDDYGNPYPLLHYAF